MAKAFFNGLLDPIRGKLMAEIVSDGMPSMGVELVKPDRYG
ncbi:MAG TPA: hypothetical protein VGK40_05095 [Verrucomicrobiae bacterium]